MAATPTPDRTSPDPQNGTTTTITITPSEILSEFSHHDPTVARINNGSFGCCPSSVIAAQRRHHLLFLRNPDHFHSHTLQPSTLLSRRIVHSLVRSPAPDHISFLDNATTAAAAVLRHIAHSLLSDTHDTVLILHYAYGAVKKSVHAYISRAGGHVVEAHLPFPVKSSSEIVSEFRKALLIGKADGRKIKLAVIDHITSMPCVIIPVKELVAMCRDEGVEKVFIDGAHAIGNVEIDVEDIGADYYTSNLHKWLFCPPSAAFLYCKTPDELSSSVESALWMGGTRDYSAPLVLTEAMEFVGRFEGGIEGIMRRNHEKIVEMARLLVDAWGTEMGAPPEMCSSMAMVGMPVSLGIGSDADALRLRRHLRECFKVEVPIYYRAPLEGEVEPITGYARISHQVYNVAEDYYRFRDAVNKLVEDGFTCALLSK